MRNTALKRIAVRAAAGTRTRGWLTAGPLAIPVALGRGGILANKREGDGATPRGRFRLVRLWWRPDRGSRSTGTTPGARIRPTAVTTGRSRPHRATIFGATTLFTT